LTAHLTPGAVRSRRLPAPHLSCVFSLSCFHGVASMWNIVIGVVFMIGGLTNTLALRDTNSSTALAVVGAGLIIWGGIQLVNGGEE